MEAHVAVKILAVDDSAVMRKIMEMTFAGEDAEVLTAASADEAIAAAHQFAPDVVFADASMTGKDGYAVASAIKSSGGKAVVIVMASQHAPYDEAKGAANGVDDHIAKPFDSQAIIDKVSAAMSGSVARKPAPVAAGGPVQAASGTPARSLKRTMAFGSPPPRPPAPPTPPAPPVKAQLEVVEEDDDPVIELSSPPAARVPSRKPAPAPAAKKPAPAPAAAAAPAAAPAASPAAAATAPGSALAGSLDALGLTKEQVESVLALSRDVVEKVVWEVVPDMAETLIREELKRLMK